MLLAKRPAPPRRGLSLMEVLVALTIFLLSFVALGKLVTISSDQAVEVQYRSEAAHLAQSKLNEVIAGSLPLSSQSGTIDEDPEWQWSVDAQQAGDVASLWTVQVRVWRQYEGQELDSTLSQMVLDPSVRGSMFDQVVVTGSQDTASQSSSSGGGNNSGSSGNNSSSSGQQGAGGGAMSGGGATGNKTGGMGTTPGKAGGTGGTGNTPGKTGGTGGNTGGKTGGAATPAPSTGGKTGGTTTGGKGG